MNPSLTRTGKLVLFAGLAYVLVGVVVSDPVLLLVAQVHFALLVLSVFLLIPGALVLDRRQVGLQVSVEGGAGRSTGHTVGVRQELELSIRNFSGVALHHFEAEAFVPAGIEASKPTGVVAIGAGSQVLRKFDVRGVRSGRWVMQGFDVCVHDPFGLMETRDYLPVVHPFEVYPFAGLVRRRRKAPNVHPTGALVGANAVDLVGSGTEIRELRDWHSGDSLKDIAWKPSVRARRLVSRDYDREETTTHYVVLDISSSMRGGANRGEILDIAIAMGIEIADAVLDRGDRVGWMTFDEKLYGHIAAAGSARQLQRIMHHVVGVHSIVDAEMTELDEDDVLRLVADYALVQERLDFRKGAQIEPESGVNRPLLERWLNSVLPAMRSQLGSSVLTEGVLSRAQVTAPREYLQLRGVEVPYRVEARLGMKERGMAGAFDVLAQVRPKVQSITVISDLNGVMNPDAILKALRGLPGKPTVEFVVPFAPAYYPADEDDDPRYAVVRGLFTSAEADERRKIVEKLRLAGVGVTVTRPTRGRLAKAHGVD